MDEQLAAAIREAMEDAHLDTQQLAARVGVGTRTLERRLARPSSLRVEELVKIGQTLGVEPWQLLGVRR